MRTQYEIIAALEAEGYDVYEYGAGILYVSAPDGQLRWTINEEILDDIYDIASMYDSVAVSKSGNAEVLVEIGV